MRCRTEPGVATYMLKGQPSAGGRANLFGPKYPAMKKYIPLLLLLLSTASQAKTLVFWPNKSDQVIPAFAELQSGDHVVFQPGVYRFPKGLSLVGRDDVTIEGRRGAEILVTNLDDAVIDLSDCHRVEIRGLKARHEKPAEEYQCEGAVIRCSNCEDIFIADNSLNGCGAAGVYAMNSKNLMITRNDIFNNTFAGVWMQDSGALVHHNKIHDNASALITYGNCNVSLTENEVSNNKGNMFYDSSLFRKLSDQ